MSYPVFASGDVLNASDMNAIGLWRVGGGTLSTSATNFVGCFTGDFTNYRIVIDSVSVSASCDIYYRMLSGTTPASGADYSYAMYSITSGGTSSNVVTIGDTYGFTGLSITGGTAGVLWGSCSFDIYLPQLAQRTAITSSAVGLSSGVFTSRAGMSVHNVATAYDGIRIDSRSAATLTGNVSIYGYRKA